MIAKTDTAFIFPCPHCGEETGALLHRLYKGDMEFKCWECQQLIFVVYSPEQYKVLDVQPRIGRRRVLPDPPRDPLLWEHPRKHTPPTFAEIGQSNNWHRIQDLVRRLTR